MDSRALHRGPVALRDKVSESLSHLRQVKSAAPEIFLVQFGQQ